MKKCIYLISFLLVALSFTANMAVDVFAGTLEFKIAEKEKEESSKETDGESDLDKDKIFIRNTNIASFPGAISSKHLLRTERIISSFLDTDINPPDLMPA